MDDRRDEFPVNSIGILTKDPLRLAGLDAICAETLHLEVVPLASLEEIAIHQIDLILIDADFTGRLLELIAAILRVHPSIKLIVLGGERSPEQVERLIEAGAKGYLPLTAQEPEIRMAIEMVRDGSVWAPRKVLSHVLDKQRTQSKSSVVVSRFTNREVEILALLRAGCSNREVALALKINEGTVKAHIGRLMRKVGVTNRIALTIHPLTQP